MSQTDVQEELKNLVDTMSPKVEAAAAIAAERGAKFAEVAADRGAKFAEVAAERGAKFAEVAADRSSEAAERLAEKLPDDVVDRLPEAIADRLPKKSRKGRRIVLVLGGVAVAGAAAFVLSQRSKPKGPEPVPNAEEPPGG